MTLEEAYYHRILLSCGFDSEYDKWLDSLLEEEPLCELALELVSCRSDIKNTVGCLEKYCRDAALDDEKVLALLRGFLKDAYYSGKMDIREVSKTMRLFAESYESGEHLLNPSDSMYSMVDCYELTYLGAIENDVFEKVFFSYLNDGISVDYKALWKAYEQKPKLDISEFLKKLIGKDN